MTSADRNTVSFPGQDVDCEIEPLPDGTVSLTVRVEGCRLGVVLPGVDAMRLGHELRAAATHASHLRRAAAEGGGG